MHVEETLLFDLIYIYNLVEKPIQIVLEVTTTKEGVVPAADSHLPRRRAEACRFDGSILEQWIQNLKI